MPALRPMSLARLPATRPVATAAAAPTLRALPREASSSSSSAVAPFSSSARRCGGGGDPHYDPPTGWLFGVKPGEKYQNEGWEHIFYWGVFGSLGLATVGYAFKPDTSIQTWALEEARRRLEAEGILAEPQDKP